MRMSNFSESNLEVPEISSDMFIGLNRQNCFKFREDGNKHTIHLCFTVNSIDFTANAGAIRYMKEIGMVL